MIQHIFYLWKEILFGKAFRKSLFAGLSLLLMLLLFSLPGCQKKAEQQEGEISYPVETAKMVSGVTSGIVSPKVTVRVRFVAPMVKENLVGSTLKETVFAFEPPIDGIARWENRRTLTFRPNAPLPLRQKYRGTLDMAKLFPRHKAEKLQPLEFAFEVAGREIATVSGDFELLKPDQPKKLIYRGTILLTQDADSASLAKATQLLRDGKNIPLQWQKVRIGKEFNFRSAPFVRGNKRRQFVLKIKKEPLELSRDFEKTFYLEALQDLKISEIRKTDLGEVPSLQIIFSDELDPDQDLTGLIRVDELPEVELKVAGKNVYVTGNFSYGKEYTVRASAGIRSKWGTVVKSEISQKVAFEDIKPQMRFLSDGVFLPSDNQQKILFQTVNLRRVRLQIKKVFESNIGQFLQTEKLSSTSQRSQRFNDWEIRRVGVAVAKQQLEIGEVRNRWLQHELDLRKIMPPDEHGLFIINLSFTRKDMLYGAGQTEEEQRRARGRYWGDSYYSDPNSPGYLYRHGKIYKPVVYSDIGLTYKSGYNQHIVFATDLLSAKPISGVTIRLRTYQNQIIAEKITDGSGSAIFGGSKEEVFYVEAEKGDQRSVIKLNEMSWNLSSFDVGGAEQPAHGVRAFIYTERGVYRPGDTLNISLIARNQENTFPDNHPVTLQIFNPKNQKVFEQTNREGRDGFYCFQFATRSEDMTGNWRATFLVGTQKFNHTIKIETVAPQRLRVKIEPEKEQLSATDRYLRFTVKSNYLFGNPAANLPAEVSVELASLTRKFPRFPGYFFSHRGREFASVKTTVFQDKLDARGTAKIRWRLPSFQNAPSAIVARIRARVFEKGGRASENVRSINIDPYDFYVGLEKPKFDYGYTRVGAPLKIRAILVNREGTPAAGHPLTYRIYKNERHWWWEYDSRSKFRLRFKSDTATELVKQGTIVSAGNPVSIDFKPEDRGEYLIEVQADNETGHTAGFFFSAYYWGESPGGKDAGLLTLKSDKKTYHPGDVAQISFPTPKEGSILLSLEKSGAILNTQWIKPSGSERETVVEIPVTAKMLPTAYVSVSVIQPHSQTLNDRPMRMYGVIPLNVEQAETRQAIEIQMPDELRSNQPFTVEVQTGDRKHTQFTIAVVDEGLLSLTRFRTPDPWKEFYKKLRLSVKTYDLFSQVIGANKGDIFKTFSVGGGYEAEQFREEQLQPQKVRRFKPVCLFRGPLMTDNRGYAKIDFQMPDYIGAVRVMVVSATGNRYGSAEKTVPVKTDLMVLPSLPRALGPGDKIVLPVTVFAMRDDIRQVAVSLNVEGPLEILGENRKTVAFVKKGEQDIQFSLRAKMGVGAARIAVSASAKNYYAQSVTELAVRPSAPRVYESQTVRCEPGKQVALTIPDRGIPGTNQAMITVMRKPKLNLTNRLRWLMRYPYGCIEQTVSAVFPQLYLKEFLENSQTTEKEIDQNINTAIKRLQKFRLPSGGFSYWPGGNEPSIWGTNYAGHFLLEAQKLGYYVPPELLRNWTKFQKSRALTTRDNLMVRVYRVYLLALAGEAPLGPMNLLKENSLKDMTDPEKWLLASAYQLTGVENVAQRILRKAGFEVKDYNEFSGTYGSGLRDKAIILNALLLFKRQAEADTLYRDISAHLATRDWYSTQTTGFALLALGKYIKANQAEFGGKNPVLAGYIVLPDGEKISFDTDKLKFSRLITEGFGKSVKIFIDKKTNLKYAYIVLDWDGVPLQPENKPVSKNLTLSVEWLNEDGMVINPSEITQGQAFWGHFTVGKAKGQTLSLEELALVQVLPAGWEIENTRLSGESIPAWMRKWRPGRAEYTDIRDDRIMWFFDMPRWVITLDFVVKLNAVTVGEFTLPPTVFEAMYNNNYRAVKPGMMVRVSSR